MQHVLWPAALSPLRQGGGPGTSRICARGRDATANATSQTEIGSHLELHTCGYTLVAPKEQDSKPAKQNLALASSATSGPPCRLPGSCVASTSCRTSACSPPHSLPEEQLCLRCCPPCMLTKWSCRAPHQAHQATILRPPLPGLDPHAAAAMGSFMRKGVFLTPGLSSSLQERTNAPWVCWGQSRCCSSCHQSH